MVTAAAQQTPDGSVPPTLLNLTPPDPVPHVAPRQAIGLVPVSSEARGKLQAKVEAFVTDLVALEPHSPAFAQRIDQLTAMGRKEISAAAALSNRFLDRPVGAMRRDEGVGAPLAELRRTVEELEPGAAGALSPARKLLGFIPFGNRLKRYFQSYQSAQEHIQAVLTHLSSGRDELLMDNAAIDVERQKLWAAMGDLEQMIQISQAMDERLEQVSADYAVTDPEKDRALRESALFQIRQRTQDLMTQMAVTVQGYLALDLVKKNNTELVKGVDRASTTTIAALRTAVTVAEAMTNQQLVLEQVTALNSTTAQVIAGTGELLKRQTARIHEEAVGSTLPMETLQQAFQDIYDTIDAVDGFKIKALASMQQTIETLAAELEKSRAAISRAKGGAEGPDDGTDAAGLAGNPSPLELG